MMVTNLVMGVPLTLLDRTGVEAANFERVTGIKKTRRYDGTTTNMILETAKACGLAFSEMEIKNLIVVTQSPDRLSPCMAVDIQSALGLAPEVLCFDVNHACDGWIVGLHLAEKLGDTTLLICADRLRYEPNPIEQLIFSDSVSIALVADRGPGGNAEFWNNGKYSDKIYCGLNGEMAMDGSFVFDFVTTEVPRMIKKYKSENGCPILVPHQANLAMIKLLAVRSGYSGRWLSSIEEYGNQSMNSIPMAIVHNYEVARGQNLLLCGFGAGMSVALMKFFCSASLDVQVVTV